MQRAGFEVCRRSRRCCAACAENNEALVCENGGIAGDIAGHIQHLERCDGVATLR